MSNIIRVEHSKNYTVISNDAIRDKRISLKARGLHHLLLSYPDSWRISIEHLSGEASDKDARTAIQSALKELEDFGYLTREQVRDKKGRITGWENVIRELPQAGFPTVDKPTSGKPHNRKNRKRENPTAENPTAENQRLINTDSYEVPINKVPIPLNPPREITGGGEEIPSKEETQQEIIPSLPDQTEIDPGHDNPEKTKYSAAPPCDNSAFVGNGNLAPDGKTRPFNQHKGTWKSVASDAWMQSGLNPMPEFKQWLHQQYQQKGKNLSLADAASEIRNDYARASDLWAEYQHGLTKRQQSEKRLAQLQIVTADANKSNHPSQAVSVISEDEKEQFRQKLLNKKAQSCTSRTKI